MGLLLRPDAVVYKPGVTATVIDVTIVAAIPGELSAGHARKIRKYDKPDVRTLLSIRQKLIKRVS